MAEIKRHRLIISNKVTDSGRVVPHGAADEADTWPDDLYDKIIESVAATVTSNVRTRVRIDETIILLRLTETVDENGDNKPPEQQSSTADATTQPAYDDERVGGDQQTPGSDQS